MRQPVVVVVFFVVVVVVVVGFCFFLSFFSDTVRCPLHGSSVQALPLSCSSRPRESIPVCLLATAPNVFAATKIKSLSQIDILT